MLKPTRAIAYLYKDKPAISQIEVKTVCGNPPDTDIGMQDVARHRRPAPA